MTRACLALLIATAFFTPLSSTLAYLSLTGLLICTVADTALRGSWRDDLTLLRRHPMVLATLALLAWVALSTFWSAAPSRAAWSQWGRYLPMLIVPIAVLVLNRPGVSGQSWVRVWVAFGAAMVLTVLLSYGSTVWPFELHWPVGPDNPAVFKHYIIQGVFSSLLVAGCVAGVLGLRRVGADPRPLKSDLIAEHSASLTMALLLIAGASAWNIVSLLPGKTGLLALVVALLPLPFCVGSRRVRLSAAVLVAAAIAAVVLIPGTARDRTIATAKALLDPASWNRPTTEGLLELPDRQAPTVIRAKFLTVSATIIEEHPWFGSGARSYQREFCARAGPSWCEISKSSSGQPHNQWALFWVEQGLVGVALFFIWCCASLASGRWQPPRNKRLTPYQAQRGCEPTGIAAWRYLRWATGCVFFIHSMLDSTLHLATEGLLYPLLLAVMVHRGDIKSTGGGKPTEQP